jgi:hypothetical protein
MRTEAPQRWVSPNKSSTLKSRKFEIKKPSVYLGALRLSYYAGAGKMGGLGWAGRGVLS